MKFNLLILSLICSCLYPPHLYAQDIAPPISYPNEIHELPLSLEKEEEQMILERMLARNQQVRNEIKREISQLEVNQTQMNGQLIHLQKLQQKASNEYGFEDQNIQALRKAHEKLKNKRADELLELDFYESASQEGEDWEKDIARTIKQIEGIQRRIESLDYHIGTYQRSIVRKLDDEEDLQDRIEEGEDMVDQLRILKTSNQALLKKLEE